MHNIYTITICVSAMVNRFNIIPLHIKEIVHNVTKLVDRQGVLTT